jgi:hypothetical protein
MQLIGSDFQTPAQMVNEQMLVAQRGQMILGQQNRKFCTVR